MMVETDQKLILAAIKEAVVELDSEETLTRVKAAIDAQIPPRVIIQEGLAQGLEEVGYRYEQQEYFLSELILSSNVFQKAMEVLEPLMGADSQESLGKIIIGTVQGDLHDLGKNIMISLLRSVGFEVYDLGIDVPPQKFVEKIKEVQPQIVGMCALLTVVRPMVKDTIDAIKAEGLRESLNIMLGGRALSEELATEYDADIFCASAWEGVMKAREFVSG